VERKKAFNPGDTVTSITGQVGVVVSEAQYQAIRKGMKEARRPGYYFSPGCCAHPDYVIQVPVLFEDETYDVMRSMNIRKTPDIPEEKRAKLRRLLAPGRHK